MLELSIENNVKVLKACAALHNFCIDQEEEDEDEALNEDVSSFTATNGPSGFSYLPSRVEDRDDFEEFVQSTVKNHAIVRRVIVDFMRLNDIQRPHYNIARNSGTIDVSESNIEFYTTI